MFFSGEPLKIINHPKSLSSVSPGTPVSFTVQATEMDQLSYQWQWKPPAEEEDEWQEAEEQKQQVELERNATVQEMKAKESLKAQIHAHLGRL